MNNRLAKIRPLLHSTMFISTLLLPTLINSAPSDKLFFKTLSSLCGSSYRGEMTYPIEGQDAFKDKVLVARIAECTEHQISIRFNVGEDTSRTWLIRKTNSSLELKHDHRHADGTPDEVTLYGGTSVNGTALSQYFPADSYTQKLIPEAASNVWSITLSDDLDTLTYHLQRHDKPRFTAVLNRID